MAAPEVKDGKAGRGGKPPVPPAPPREPPDLHNPNDLNSACRGSSPVRQERLSRLMEKIAGAGYRHLELARAPFDPAIWKDIGRAASAAEITIESTQIKLGDIEADIGKTIEMHRSLPCRRVVVSVLPLRLVGAGAAAYRDFAGRLNGLGETLKEAGLELLYHHHHFEFLPLKDDKTRTGMDILVEKPGPGPGKACPGHLLAPAGRRVSRRIHPPPGRHGTRRGHSSPGLYSGTHNHGHPAFRHLPRKGTPRFHRYLPGLPGSPRGLYGRGTEQRASLGGYHRSI